MNDKTPIIILVVLFIILGFAYKSDFSSTSRRSSTDSSSSPSMGKPSDIASSPNKQIGIDIKNVEKNINKLDGSTGSDQGQSYSPYYGKIIMSGISGVRGNDPSKESITIRTKLERDEVVNITGWYFKSGVTGYYATIGKAALLPFPYTNTESDVVLQQGDRVVIVKGFSPIGISFRTNICTGYFEENRTFVPGLPKKCPLPRDEDLPTFSSVYDRNDECLDIIDNIRRCTTVNSEFIRDLPDTVTQSCKNYLTSQINYNSCVANHFGDTSFPGNEYRLYLKKFGPLWRKEREKITLYDRRGLIVDSIEY